MDGANHKSRNYDRRNKTSYSWYSQSFPSASFLQQGLHGLAITKSKSNTTSPVKSDSGKKRPSSTYEYDGGLFSQPASARRDYFVIHPDWVSESMTVQKLSLNERKAQTWPGRRCKSAPPPKFRNPITWD